ncbi:helix-turn-helix domain-containing protein [Salinarimonas rosea]|uniref:helix-turn-helix domain-containing protein n=1 Tax=Salinarimonas rosea TaxID=552063 RepID=UPI00041344E7|nr:helix-turn-helix domain-containing protein [Salinarimonas rosea]
MADLDQHALLTLDEAAKHLRVSRRHLMTLLSDGKGPPTVALGRRKLIRPAALDRWLAERETAAA